MSVAHVKIRPTSGWRAIDVSQLWRFRDLLFALAARDIKLRYRQTALGVAWVVLQPLFAAGIFSFVFGKVAKLDSGGAPYFLFSYAGLLGWNAFGNTLTKVSGSLVGNAPLISKVFFPRLVLPLSTTFSTLVDFAVAFVMMLVLMAVNGRVPGPGILLMPVFLGVMLLYALGFGLLAASLAVSYRDVQHIIPVATQLLLYASPVAYGLAAVPEKYRAIFQLNPLVPVLEGFRWSVLGGQADWRGLLVSALIGVLLFVFGALVFRMMEKRFADVV